MADASLPDMRARNRPGTAIAAMMPMIATTISSSINVNPSCFRSRIGTSFLKKSVKRHPEDAINTAIEVPSRGYIERYGREIAGWARALRDPGRRTPARALSGDRDTNGRERQKSSVRITGFVSYFRLYFFM